MYEQEKETTCQQDEPRREMQGSASYPSPRNCGEGYEAECKRLEPNQAGGYEGQAALLRPPAAAPKKKAAFKKGSDRELGELIKRVEERGVAVGHQAGDRFVFKRTGTSYGRVMFRQVALRILEPSGGELRGSDFQQALNDYFKWASRYYVLPPNEDLFPPTNQKGVQVGYAWPHAIHRSDVGKDLDARTAMFLSVAKDAGWVDRAATVMGIGCTAMTGAALMGTVLYGGDLLMRGISFLQQLARYGYTPGSAFPVSSSYGAATAIQKDYFRTKVLRAPTVIRRFLNAERPDWDGPARTALSNIIEESTL